MKLRFRKRPRRVDALRRCPECGGRLPCPMSREPAGDEHWWVRLRCGDCGAWYEVTISNERARRFDAEFDADMRAIARALEELSPVAGP
ncbi:MAG TPA: zinc ribbon domain-containing protein [Solirubrobacteraceae bacterium]|nr:zinc ribbon domain-containing protein [Solirubrobacteraceae bacterium]